jgi:hypothetical protein
LDEGLLGSYINCSFLAELGMERVDKKVDLKIKLELHYLEIFVSH